MTNSNKLADALRKIANYDPWGSDEDEWVTSFALVQKWANEALAEHDAQPAPAPVQVDVLEPPGGNMNRPHRLMITSGEFWRCAHGLVKPPCRECDADFAPPPAPAADGAGELSDKDIRPGGGWLTPYRREPTDTSPWHVSLFTAQQAQTMIAADLAAIVALRQPVPDAVRELPGKWRAKAEGLQKSADELPSCLADVYDARADERRDCATELETALASQQESRNAD